MDDKNGLLKLVRQTEGYCGNCRQAEFVGYLQLPGWDHEYAVCGPCLQKLAGLLLRAKSELSPTGELKP